ncbi:hypothetical protein [Streptomyces sp. JJ36]|nr:hypothetical protein [Streptomyces sp. JJ36]
MGEAEYTELASRYNGGPYWLSDRAQGYGGRFWRDLDQARNAWR